MPERVRITDVGPRDGLQNETGFVPTAQKAALVRALAGCGVREVEVTSFVSPRWVPQLGDAAELCDLLATGKPSGVVYSALVPNERGMDGVLEANRRAGFRLIDKVGVFTAASESFSRKNTNASIAEAMERFGPVVRLARGQEIAVRGYVSCAIACPFEGAIEPLAVAAVAGRLVELGVDEVDLGDTIGAGTPESVGRMVGTVWEGLDEAHAGGSRANWGESVTLHLHDTHGLAGACVRVALDLGIRSFDASVAGLGGCPYAGTERARAPGNIATATLLDAVERAGFAHGVDRGKRDAGAELARKVGAGGGGGGA